MARIFFFILAFPPALMNLMLVQAHPVSLARYFLASYAVAVIPAVAVALTDELLKRTALPVRAVWCGIVGAAFSPFAVLLAHAASVPNLMQAAACGAITAFLCAMAFGQLSQRRAVATVSEPVVAVATTAAA
jgi:hypothetical protein